MVSNLYALDKLARKVRNNLLTPSYSLSSYHPPLSTPAIPPSLSLSSHFCTLASLSSSYPSHLPPFSFPLLLLSPLSLLPSYQRGFSGPHIAEVATASLENTSKPSQPRCSPADPFPHSLISSLTKSHYPTSPAARSPLSHLVNPPSSI